MSASSDQQTDSAGVERAVDVQTQRPTVLVLMAYYLPAFKAGGPVRSISGLVAALGDKFEFKIVCGDRDLNDSKPFPGEPSGCWYKYDNAQVMRLKSNVSGVLEILRVLRREKCELVYINSVFTRIYSMLPMALRALGLVPKRPVIVAPRGEFSAGALGIKPGRKRLWLAMAKSMGLFRSVIWQASSEHEKNDILRVLGTVHVRMASVIHRPQAGDTAASVLEGGVVVARDVAEVVRFRAPLGSGGPKIPGTLRIATLGRVCRMKNIDYAIKLFRNIRGSVTYDIYGPLEDVKYVEICRDTCKELPENVKVRLMGGIPHHDVQPTLAGYHLFLLPTLGENFGHVVVEAMAAGCAVLLSDRTPWRALHDAGVGWDLPLAEPERFAEAIGSALDWNDEEFHQISNLAHEYAKRIDTYAISVQENEALFRVALARVE